MISYQHLLSLFSDTLIASQIAFNQFELDYHLIFSDSTANHTLSSESIILCSVKAFSQYLQSETLPFKVCFLVSASTQPLPEKIPYNCSYIAVKDSFSDLCSRFISVYQEYARCYRLLEQPLMDSRQIHEYLQAIAAETRARLFLYNTSGDILSLSDEPDAVDTKGIISSTSAKCLGSHTAAGNFSSDPAAKFRKLPVSLRSQTEQILELPNIQSFAYLECQTLETQKFYLYVISSTAFHHDIAWIAGQALASILQSFSEFHTILYTEEETRTGAFIADIMNQKCADFQEDYSLFRNLAHYDSCYTTIFYIQFSDPEPASSRIFFLNELRQLIPEAVIGPWKQDLVVFVPNPDRHSRLEVYDQGLQDLLTRYQAYAGCSLWTKWRFRTSILLAASNAKFGQFLGLEPSRRIFYNNEYSFYNLIDLAADSYYQVHHSKDLTYLLHPCVLHVNRYDIAHDTNLLEVLYHYLLNGCRVNDTAVSLNMHRNTVQGKLNKLTEIIHEDFTRNGLIQCRILISCMIFFYQDRYLKVPFSLPQSMSSSFHQLESRS